MTYFRTLARALWLGFVRDRRALFFTVIFPLMFLCIFGLLFRDAGTSKAKVVEVGQVQVLDAAMSGSGGKLGEVLAVTRMDDLEAALTKVKDGDFAAAISAEGSTVKVHYSAADQVKGQMVVDVLRAVVGEANSVVPKRVQFAADTVEDKSLKAIQCLTPGLLGWAIATGAVFGAAQTLVTWREKKILRRLRLSPVSPGSVAGARVAVSMAVAIGQGAIFVGVASLPFFGLKLAHNWWMAIPMLISGTLAFLAIGLFIGAIAKTIESAQVIAQLAVLPMAFLSGSFFPLDNAPKWLQTVSNIFPLKHLNQGMLDAMVRTNKSVLAILPQMGILLGFAVVVGAIAIRLFRWDDA